MICAGLQTAALAFGGTVATPATPGNRFKNESEEYNGSSWTEGNNLNQARSGISGGGTQISYAPPRPCRGPDHGR